MLRLALKKHVFHSEIASTDMTHFINILNLKIYLNLFPSQFQTAPRRPNTCHMRLSNNMRINNYLRLFTNFPVFFKARGLLSSHPTYCRGNGDTAFISMTSKHWAMGGGIQHPTSKHMWLWSVKYTWHQGDELHFCHCCVDLRMWKHQTQIWPPQKRSDKFTKQSRRCCFSEAIVLLANAFLCLKQNLV